MSKEGKNIYIYRSLDLADKNDKNAQQQVLEDLYGNEAVFITCEDGSFISNDDESSILIQEYIK